MSGYLMCLSNPSYADCYYISVSAKKPSEKADELYSEGVLWPFKIELAKSVTQMDGKLVSLHKLICKLGDRLTPDRDFFRIPIDTVQSLFDLVDGEAWVASEGAVPIQDKIMMVLKQENPKSNEFQLNKMKMKVAASLKGLYGDGVDPTLEMVREVMDQMRRGQEVVPV